MNKKLAFLLSAGSLFVSGEVYANAMCKIVPSCEGLGYSMKASECASLGDNMQMLKCPFDNSMVYCPEDCQTYPIVGTSCDTSIGSCVRCATANRWKYINCKDGYVLLNGECKQTTCSQSVYIYNNSNKPDAKKGTIVSCKSGTETRYGYSSCNEGWKLVGANCVDVDCGAGYVTIDECPNFADCTDRCMSGTTEKVNIKCNEGLVRQGITCVKNKVGSVYEYKGVPIGVVFYDDGYTTKIIALHDIDQNGQAVAKDAIRMEWATETLNSDIKCANYDIEELRNNTSSGAKNDMNGFENTKTILEFANYINNPWSPRCWMQPAIASYLYHPEVCEEGSFCGKGKWYLPAIGELIYLYKNYQEGTLIYDALHDTESGAIPLSNQSNNWYYWSSTESSAAYVYVYNDFLYPTTYGKSNKEYVRPMLEF